MPAQEKLLTLAFTAPFPMPWQLSGCLIGNAGDVPKICSFGCLKDEEGFCVLFPLALALEKNAAALVPGQKEGGALERK